MGRVDDSGSGPTLNPKAKHYERELFKVFAVSTGSIVQTQSDWGDAKKQLEDLAKDVRTVRGELKAPADGSKGWSGPAAAAALSSLERLSETLDTHAGEVGAVDTSLGQAHTAVSTARVAWFSEVTSTSTYVDPDAHKRLPAPYLPTAENKAAYSIRDPEAAAAAEDALWEKRNQAAKKVLDQLTIDMTQAKGTMPLNFKDDKETPYENQGPASTNRTSGTASQSGADVRPTGTLVGTGLQVDPTNVNGLPEPTEITTMTPTEPPEPKDPEICTGLPWVEPTFVDPISSDGDVTGSTGLTPGQGPDGTSGGYPTGGSTGVGGVGAGGVAAGGMGGAAGLGGLLGKRGAGGMFSSGGSTRGSSATARGGSASARGTATGSGAGARGSAVRGGSARPGGSQMAPGAGGGRSGGAAGRGGSAARGGSSVKGSTGAGKYGVPKVGKGGSAVGAGGGQGPKGGAKAGGSGGRGAGSGGRGAGAGGSGAAGRGGARKGDKNQLHDVDKLTHEDEEAWFEGTEESSPQVWE